MYNYYRNVKNDHYAVIVGLTAGWISDVWLGVSTPFAVGLALAVGLAFRLGVWFSPLSEAIPSESSEHINSTPWQQMRDLDEVRYASDSEYVDRDAIE